MAGGRRNQGGNVVNRISEQMVSVGRNGLQIIDVQNGRIIVTENGLRTTYRGTVLSSVNGRPFIDDIDLEAPAMQQRIIEQVPAPHNPGNANGPINISYNQNGMRIEMRNVLFDNQNQQAAPPGGIPDPDNEYGDENVGNIQPGANHNFKGMRDRIINNIGHGATLSRLGSGDITINGTIDSGVIINSTGSGDIIINGRVNPGVTINCTGSGDLRVNGQVGENVHINIVGSGDARFALRPPQSVINALHRVGTGSVHMPGGYQNNRPNRPHFSFGNVVIGNPVINRRQNNRNVVHYGPSISNVDIDGDLDVSVNIDNIDIDAAPARPMPSQPLSHSGSGNASSPVAPQQPIPAPSKPAPKSNNPVDARIAQALRNYIGRIERYRFNGAIDFTHGFWLFKNSRALNREANYLLAQSLLAKIESANRENRICGSSLFHDINRQRRELILRNRLDRRPHFSNHGINSRELKAILKIKR